MSPEQASGNTEEIDLRSDVDVRYILDEAARRIEVELQDQPPPGPRRGTRRLSASI